LYGCQPVVEVADSRKEKSVVSGSRDGCGVTAGEVEENICQLKKKTNERPRGKT
jgi:hypothetical protein